jgi:hypothetical protein
MAAAAGEDHFQAAGRGEHLFDPRRRADLQRDVKQQLVIISFKGNRSMRGHIGL